MHRYLLNILLFLALAMLLVGCEPEIRVVRSSWDDFPADPKPSRNQPAGQANQNTMQDQTWAIQVIRLEGQDRYGRAQKLVEQLRSQSISNLWIGDHDNVITVYLGRFTSATDPEIRPALAKIRSVQIEGEKPFADCQLIPLTGSGLVINDPLDLRQFVGYYSLQIGFYDKNFDGDFRVAAEQAVKVLREEGHEAYYYHGPFRSIIAIGVFSYDQAFVSAGTHDTYSPIIHELQKKFPYNLGNGLTLVQKENGRVIGEQKSSLIRVF